MQFITFLKYQCALYLRRWRWLIPIPMGLLLGYWGSNVVRALNPLPLTDAAALDGNALEAFIWAFGKPEVVYFVATALFIYLVSDYLPETAYEQSVLMRLGSRTNWWFAKVSLVFLSALLFAVILFGSFFVMVLPQYPISAEWSPSGLFNGGLGLGYSVINGGPVQGALSTGALLVLGWFAIGLLVLTVNQLFRRSWAGFMVGAMLIVVAKLGSLFGGPIGGEGWVSYIMIQNHLEYSPLWSPVRSVPFSATWIFWSVWILLCCLIGWMSSKRGDILAIEH